MMKKLCFILLSLISVNSFAAFTISGKVKTLYPSHTGSGIGVVYFKLHTSQCPANAYMYFNLDDVGKAWYSLLLAASNTGKSINVSLNHCPTDGVDKDIRYLYQNFDQ
jgi:hypothetical protein